MSESLPSTHFSELVRVIDKDDSTRQQAVLQLLEAYCPGLCTYAAGRFHMDQDEAEDMVRGFILDKAVMRGLVERYTQATPTETGRRSFRGYLVRALRNHVIDALRRRQLDRQVQQIVARPEQVDGEISSVISAESFRDIVRVVFRRVRSGCFRKGRQRDWDLFFLYRMSSLFPRLKRFTYEELAQRFGCESGKQASNCVITMQRAFERTLRRVLEEDLGTSDSEAVQEELREVHRAIRHVKAINMPELYVGPAQFEAPAEADLVNAAAAQMTSTLDLASFVEHDLTETELLVLYQGYYLSASFVSLFEQADVPVPPVLCQHTSESGPKIDSVEQLIQHEPPPLALLNELKLLARRVLKSPEPKMPTQIALVLRFVSIGLAVVWHGQTVSKLTDEELRQGFQRVSEYAWIDKQAKALFRNALNRL